MSHGFPARTHKKWDGFHSLILKRDRAYSNEVLVLNLLSLKSLAPT